MKTVFRVLAVLAAFGLAAACSGRTKSDAPRGVVEEVTADGTAVYNEKDLTATTNAAVTDAQRNALEAAAGLFMDYRSRTGKYGEKRQNLLKAPGVYVKKYKMLSGRREGSVYRVEIKAWLYIDKVASALKGLDMTEAARPGTSAALMLDEYLGPAARVRPRAEIHQRRGQGPEAFAYGH
jgi:hypothetical protein